jgi:hypothetical protein
MGSSKKKTEIQIGLGFRHTRGFFFFGLTRLGLLNQAC